MQIKAAIASIAIGAAVLAGIVALRVLRGLFQTVLRVGLVLVVVFVVYEIWSGWTR